MLNLLFGRKKQIEKTNPRIGKKNRVMRFVTGAVMVMSQNRKQPGIMSTGVKLLGCSFMVYGLTGWDPIESVVKMDKVRMVKRIAGAIAQKDDSQDGILDVINDREERLVRSANGKHLARLRS